MFSEKREHRTGPEGPCCDFMQKQRDIVYPEVAQNVEPLFHFLQTPLPDYRIPL